MLPICSCLETGRKTNPHMTENSNKDFYGSVNAKCSYLPPAFGGNIYVVRSDGGTCDIRDLKHRER